MVLLLVKTSFHDDINMHKVEGMCQNRTTALFDRETEAMGFMTSLISW